MGADTEQWRLDVVWRQGKRSGQLLASYPLDGLDERTVCRSFGFAGSHVPRFPVPVTAEQVDRVQPYSPTTIRFPPNTTGELYLDGDASTRRDLLPLLIVTLVTAALAFGAWHYGSNQSGLAGTALHLLALVLWLVAAWCLVSSIVLAMSVRVDRRAAKRAP